MDFAERDANAFAARMLQLAQLEDSDPDLVADAGAARMLQLAQLEDSDPDLVADAGKPESAE